MCAQIWPWQKPGYTPRKRKQKLKLSDKLDNTADNTADSAGAGSDTAQLDRSALSAGVCAVAGWGLVTTIGLRMLWRRS